MTLVEVIAGLTLLATIGVGSMMAFGVHQRQIKTASQTIEATQIADGLLSRWSADFVAVPVLQAGPTGQPNWFWQTQPVRAEVVAGVPVQIVRLDVLFRNQLGELQTRASVEVLVPLEKDGAA